jgi:hypothetical protein
MVATVPRGAAMLLSGMRDGVLMMIVLKSAAVPIGKMWSEGMTTVSISGPVLVAAMPGKKRKGRLIGGRPIGGERKIGKLTRPHVWGERTIKPTGAGGMRIGAGTQTVANVRVQSDRVAVRKIGLRCDGAGILGIDVVVTRNMGHGGVQTRGIVAVAHPRWS